MKASRVALSILAGAAVGALAGILFAPYKGTKTRKKLYKKGRDMANGIKEEAHHLSDQATEVVDRFADKIHSMKQEVKAKAENNRPKEVPVK